MASHHLVVLALIEGIEDHLKDPFISLNILAIFHIVQTVTDTVGIVDVGQQGGCQLIISHIRLLALNLLNKFIPVFIKHDLSKVASLIAAKLQEVVFENTTHHV